MSIAGRSPERGAKVVQRMQEAAGADSAAKFSFVPCNCFSMKAVEECSNQFLSASEDPVLDYLVMTQGMATIQGFTPTEDGLDQKLMLHVWSRAAFAQHLLPALKRAQVRDNAVICAEKLCMAIYAGRACFVRLERGYSWSIQELEK